MLIELPRSKLVEVYVKMNVVLSRSTPRPFVVGLLSCAVVAEKHIV